MDLGLRRQRRARTRRGCCSAMGRGRSRLCDRTPFGPVGGSGPSRSRAGEPAGEPVAGDSTLVVGEPAVGESILVVGEPAAGDSILAVAGTGRGRDSRPARQEAGSTAGAAHNRPAVVGARRRVRCTSPGPEKG